MVYIMQKEQQDALQAASLHREKAVSFMAVSYTHLDVYKRQTEHLVEKSNGNV